MPQKAPEYIKVQRVEIESLKNNRPLIDRLIFLSNSYNGSMTYWLNEALKNINQYNVIYIAKDKRCGEVVGWVMVSESMADSWGISGNKIGTYVDHNFRRMGIGTRLVKAVRRATKTFACWTGNNVADSFYSSVVSGRSRKELNSCWQTVVPSK
jgi:GNAT superfamily N-acetyltransferase